MSFQPLAYVKEHPVSSGIILVVGGFIFIMIVRGSGGSSGGSSSASGPSDAEIAANAQIMAAQIQAQATAAAAGADVTKTNILAGVQMNSDKLASEVAFRQLDVSRDLGLASIDADKTTGLASINAQQQMYITNSNNQVETQKIIASVSKKKSSNSTIGGIAGAALSVIGGIFSDQRLKENFTYLGRAPQGYGIYRFNYKGSKQQYIGVIADDVAEHVPGAVVENERGFQKVLPWKLNFDSAATIPGAQAA